jgi:hypothetical protein
MDNENYRDLARKAWELDKALETVRKIPLQMFLGEFIVLDEEEYRKQFMNTTEPPF